MASVFERLRRRATQPQAVPSADDQPPVPEPPADPAPPEPDWLPPADALQVDAADPELDQALRWAVEDDPGVLHALLLGTRLEQDWERRSHAMRRAARQLVTVPHLVDRWAAGRPADPDLVMLQARTRIHQAWRARSAGLAADLTEHQRRAFSGLLLHAGPYVERAIALAPEDPTTYEAAIDRVRGLGPDRAAFGALVDAATLVAPHEVGWQAAALRWLSPRWHGSAEEVIRYAAAAASAAPVTSRVRMLPVLALADVWVSAGLPGATDPTGDRDTVLAQVDEVVAAAHEHLAGVPDSIGRTEGRSELAHLLVLVGAPGAAYPLFVEIGDQVTERPWLLNYHDPVATFLAMRGAAQAAHRPD
ncbi:MAG TPA: hypothetical protein P5181_15400 [Dermatophilaceae bacterium]|nr:hypothetical protein [Dermatophilaceae bacterium]